MKVLKTVFNERELKNINEVLATGNIGFGSNVQEFENRFKLYSKKEYNIAVNSASAAAFIIFAYLKHKYGTCDVYTPSLAFTSPAWAAKHFGHKLIWVDVNSNLLFDCEDYLEKSELPKWKEPTGRKKVVMPILYGGVSSINNWKLRGNEVVVVDSAHCITPTIESDFTFFSFHPTKPVCTSDGGMISTDNKEAFDYFSYYRNFGRSNITDGYTIVEEGFKFYMNNLNATIGLISLDSYYQNLTIRKENYILLKEEYGDALLNHDTNSSYYFGTLITDQAEELNRRYNLARHYPPLHKTEYYKGHSILPSTEKLYKQLVNLPLNIRIDGK